MAHPFGCYSNITREPSLQAVHARDETLKG